MRRCGIIHLADDRARAGARMTARRPGQPALDGAGSSTGQDPSASTPVRVHPPRGRPPGRYRRGMISSPGASIGIALYILVILALVALGVLALVVLIRLALTARRALLVTTELQEARLELIREQTARLQADDGDGDGDADGGPYAPGGGTDGPAGPVGPVS
jgi:hypothetical protein